MTRIIGIDPGIINTGWAIIDSKGSARKYIASGVILPPKKEDLATRIGFIYSEVLEIINTYKPDEFAIEIIFVNMNPKTTLILGHARAAAIIAAAISKIDVYEYEPNKIKKALTGAGHASKEQITKMIKILLPESNPKTPDEADAIAIAIAHSNTSKLKF